MARALEDGSGASSPEVCSLVAELVRAITAITGQHRSIDTSNIDAFSVQFVELLKADGKFQGYYVVVHTPR